jgi:hypothetical protein
LTSHLWRWAAFCGVKYLKIPADHASKWALGLKDESNRWWSKILSQAWTWPCGRLFKACIACISIGKGCASVTWTPMLILNSNFPSLRHYFPHLKFQQKIACSWGKWHADAARDVIWAEVRGNICSDPKISHFLRLRTLVASGTFVYFLLLLVKSKSSSKGAVWKIHGCRVRGT